LTKLAPAGDTLVYSTCLGSYQSAGAVTLDPSGKAYLTGYTIGDLPVTASAYQASLAGNADAFVTVIDTTASGTASLVYSTYLGGSTLFGTTQGFNPGADQGLAIAVDAYGMVYVAGQTASSDFPVTTGAFQTTFAGPTVCSSGVGGVFDWCYNAFIAKLNPNGSGARSLIYSTYLGGSEGAGANGIAVDSLGEAYVTGGLEGGGSPLPIPFPTTPGAFQGPDRGNVSAFVTKFNAAGNHLVYSTLLSGPGSFFTSANAIALDSFGDAFITGVVKNAVLPVTPDAFQPTYQGGGSAGYDAFVTKFNSTGSALIYSSYLGGRKGNDVGHAIAVDPVGDAYVAGDTGSIDFPVVQGAFQLLYGGGSDDAFVTKFPLGSPGGLFITGVLPNAGGNAGTVSPTIVGSGFHAGAAVQLTCAGGSRIAGSNAAVGTEGRTLTTSFNLTGASAGTCDVAVTNVDGTSAKLRQGFTVQQGGAFNLVVQKTGFEAVPGRTVTYFISVANTGNLDSRNGAVTETLDPEFTLTSVSPQAIADVSTLAADSFILWGVPLLPAGQSMVFTYAATLAASTPVGSTVAGGPGCYIIGVDLAGFCGCLGENSTLDSIGACAGAVGTCIATVGACLAVGPTCAPGPTFNPALCLATQLGCWGGALACAGGAVGCYSFARPIVNKCLNSNSATCDTFLEQAVTNFVDPNYQVGPKGVGTQRWVSGQPPLTYAIHFENDPKAQVPVQVATVTDPLDPNVASSTLMLATISFPGAQVTIPATFNPVSGLDEFTTNVDLRPTQSLFVLVDGRLDPTSGLITWTLTSIDPTTGQIPVNPLVGFLAPGAEASVAFTVMPKPGLPTGTEVPNQGSVVFGTEPPVKTNIWTNTVDNTPPTSDVASLPDSESCPNFKVNWSGSDVGSGTKSFTIYYSDNSGPFEPWLTNTAHVAATFQGQLGHSYGFYSIAQDLVGNIEPSKSSAEASTEVASTAACGPPSLSGTASVTSFSGGTLTLSLQLTDTGTGDAQNTLINQLTFRTLGGTGNVTLAAPRLPISAGNLPVGTSNTLLLTLNVPSTVTKFSIRENGTMQDDSGKAYSYSIGQLVIP